VVLRRQRYPTSHLATASATAVRPPAIMRSRLVLRDVQAAATRGAPSTNMASPVSIATRREESSLFASYPLEGEVRPATGIATVAIGEPSLASAVREDGRWPSALCVGGIA
jgi:hypothetical protein